MNGSERFEAGFLGGVRRGAVLVCVLLAVGALVVDRSALGGMLLGGGISIGSLELYRLLAAALLHPGRGRRARVWLYRVWVVKWPGLWVLLYWAMGEGRVTLESLCVGLGVVPAAVAVQAVRGVVVELRRDRMQEAAELRSASTAEGQR